MTTYYVSTSGDDGADGSSGTPWLTLTHAAGQLAAGDTLYIRGGVYQEKVRFGNSGTAAQPIQIMSYPGETAIVDGNNYTLPATQTNSSLVVIGGDYIELSDIEVRDSLWAGLEVGGVGDVITNCTAHGNMEQGLVVWAATGAIIQDCTVYGNAFSNENGIHKLGRTTYAGGLNVGGHSDGTTVRRCTTYHNWGEGLSVYNSTNTVMEDNVVYDNSKEVYISDTTDCLCQRNLIYSTPGNANRVTTDVTQHSINLQDENQDPASARITVINNLVLGGVTNFKWYPRNGVDAGGNPVDSAMTDVLVANNTFVNATGTSSDPAFYIADPVGISNSGVLIENNIIVQEDTQPIGEIGPAAQAGVTFANNSWSKSPPAEMLGSGSLVGDPLLAKNGTNAPGALTGDYFKITSGSPAIDAGLGLAEVTDDYFGQGRPVGAAPDIGGHEYVADRVTSDWSAPASATTLEQNTASGTAVWSGTANGRAVLQGSASATVLWAGSAAGITPVVGAHAGTASGTHVWVGSTTGAFSDITVQVGQSRVGSLAVAASRQAYDLDDARVGSVSAGSSRQAWSIATSRIDREA
jgi:parallel beta-helix repeat protein